MIGIEFRVEIDNKRLMASSPYKPHNAPRNLRAETGARLARVRGGRWGAEPRAQGA